MSDVSEAMESEPFKKLTEEQVKSATESAEAALDRQRKGIDKPGSSGKNVVSESSDILLGPKEGPTTKGVAWGEANQESKGLIGNDVGYYYVCEYDACVIDWSTEVLPKDQVSVLVKMYEMHVSQYHDRKNSTSEQGDKDEENYAEVTKMRVIEAHKDNRMDVLSYVRFLPMPLQYQQIAAKQPAKQTPVWARIDLSHLGIHLADNSIITKLHDRGYAAAQLKFFSPTNLGLNENDKDLMLKPSMNGMKTARNIREISSVPEAVGALLNFLSIWNHIHPMDWGSPAIVRFLMDKIHHVSMERRLTNVRAICRFFQSAFKGNADRVQGPDGPRTYADLVTFYNSMDWSSSESAKSVLYGQAPGKSGGKRSHSETPKKERKESKKEFQVCYKFNNKEGCDRSDGSFCRYMGKTFKHLCSFKKEDGTVCGAEDHGKQEHED